MKFRRFERYNEKEVDNFLPVFWEYWVQVNEEDSSDIVEFEFLGQKFKMPQIELILYSFLNDGARVQLALKGDEIVGFMIYHIAYNCFLAIDVMYVMPEHEKDGMGKQLVMSLEQPIKKVIFQTRKKNQPERLLDMTKKIRTKIYEDKKRITWEMPWEA